jgi:hypothetical protein
MNACNPRPAEFLGARREATHDPTTGVAIISLRWRIEP